MARDAIGSGPFEVRFVPVMDGRRQTACDVAAKRTDKGPAVA